MVHIHQERARFSETDTARMVHWSIFGIYYEESLISMIRTGGMDFDQNSLEKSTQNTALTPVVGSQIEFASPVKFGDKVNIYSAISHLGEKSFTSFHILQQAKNRKLCNYGTVTRVTTSHQTFKAVPIPTELKGILRNNIITPFSFTKNFVEELLTKWTKLI